MGNASARDWDPIIGKRFNPLETVNTHTHIMCADIPNAFVQAEMQNISDSEERVTMKAPKSTDHRLCWRNSERSFTFKC